jgi:hypothetical protein
VANRRWKASNYALLWRRDELLVPGDFAGRARGAWWGPVKGIALVLEALVVVVYCSKWKLPDSFSDPRCSYRIGIFTVQIPSATCGVNSLKHRSLNQSTTGTE